MTRLPIPGKDAGAWGEILNGYLSVSHNPDGTLRQAATISGAEQQSNKGKPNGYAALDASTRIPAIQLGGSTNDTTLFLRSDRSWVSVPTASDATTNTMGIVQLAGDLTGTASAPTVKNLERVFNAQDYGAKGDGSTDDTAALNATLSAGSGATVYIPQGTYVVRPGVLNNIPGNTKVFGAGIGNTILILPDSFNNSGDLFQVVSVSNVEVSGFTLDGNSSNQTGSNKQYGLYLSTSTNCRIHDVLTKNWTGDGLQLYNDTGCMVSNCYATANGYHGFEVEQCVNCTVSSCRGFSNTLHGIIITPGEVGSTGSQGNHIIGNTFDDNGNYGICVNWDNAESGAQLSEGNIMVGNSITGNAYYGVCFYGESMITFTNNYIYNNGYHGLYGFESAYNLIQNNYFHNNSQASNGAYDEIYFEGATNGFASAHNVIMGNHILINGTNKANYAISEGTPGDGPNIIMNNVIPNSGLSGTYNIQNTATQLGPVDTSAAQTIAGSKTFSATITGTQGFEVSADASLASGMGLDAPFGTAALRVYNSNSNGNVQLVTVSGEVDVYASGNNSLTVAGDHIDIHNYPVINVQDPVSAQGAATKNYVDTTAAPQVGTGDVTITDSSKGFVLTDRGTHQVYRLYVDNGTLGTEIAS